VATLRRNSKSKWISFGLWDRFQQIGSAFAVKRRWSLRCRCSLDRLKLWVPILGATLLLASLPAFAGLGEDADSVAADQAHMQASLRITQTQAYTLREMRAPTGTVVREYVSPSGIVFGVAWQGPWPPDMRHILANYFGQYQQAAQAEATSRGGRRPLVIELPGFVLQSGGHMRSFAGRAYIPQMLPRGTVAEAIR
jgi:Protein of unknown function (DUF2844)